MFNLVGVTKKNLIKERFGNLWFKFKVKINAFAFLASLLVKGGFGYFAQEYENEIL